MKQYTPHTAVISRWLLCLPLLLITLSSCYREQPVTSELGKPKYEITDSSDPLDHMIYEIYQSTGVQVIYNFDPEDAAWNLGTVLGGSVYKVIDATDPAKRTSLLAATKILKEQVIDTYPSEFGRKYFPLRIFLCDSIGASKRSQPLIADGRDHIALNVRTADDTLITEEDYTTSLPPALHGVVWQNAFKYRIPIPERFYTYSGEWYGKNLPHKKEELTAGTYDVRQDGFWTYDDMMTFTWIRAIKAEQDIADYIVRMTQMSEAQIRAQMAGYDVMVSKYTLLREYILSQTGLDLQSIGDAAAAQ